eukprot:XP_027307079.1 stathmin domain-containing protein 1 isoform X1 [Anas platyrhynchos]
MGCNTSHRVAGAQLPSEELEKNQEAKSQATSGSIARTGAVTSWDGAACPASLSESGSNVEGKARKGDSPEEFAERFTPSQNRSNAQSTDALLTSEFISQSRPLQETERQKSSDILEELRMQGIIRSQSTTARTEEVYENKFQLSLATLMLDNRLMLPDVPNVQRTICIGRALLEGMKPQKSSRNGKCLNLFLLTPSPNLTV